MTPCLTTEPAFGEVAAAEPCAVTLLDIAGRGALTWPDIGVSRSFSLPRARAEGRLGVGNEVHARVAVGVVRSGGDAGYIGVDGEALVPEVQVAEARLGWAPWGLAAGTGLVDESWVTTGDAAWGMRALAPGLGEGFDWLEPADLGGWVAWTAPGRVVDARVELTTGEGLRYRERNDGKDLAAVLQVRPLGERLSLALYGREGSRGLALAPDHRVGARVSGVTSRLRYGLEGLLAVGVDGDAERAPLGGAGWLVARPWGPLLAAARADLASEDLTDAQALRGTVIAAAGIELGPGQVLLGYTGTRVGSRVATLSGGDALDDSDTVFLQLGVRLDVAELSQDRNVSVPGVQ